MMNVMEKVASYIAVWNEPNVDERGKRVRAVWAPDGTSCYSALDTHGYEAIEARVTRSWDKWLSEGKYIFRPQQGVASHHNVIRVNWEMVTVPGSTLASLGLSFLVLNSDGQVQHDYQFSPTASDGGHMVERYVAVLNEPSAEARRTRIAELWAPDGEYLSETSVTIGRSAIEARVAEIYDSHGSKGLTFSSAGHSHHHHNLARFNWRLCSKDGAEVTATGSDLLVLNDDGRIRLDYQFHDSV